MFRYAPPPSSSSGLNDLAKALIGDLDFEELNSEKVCTQLKTQDEVNKLIIDENISEIDRAVYLLGSSGTDDQRYSIDFNYLYKNYWGGEEFLGDFFLELLFFTLFRGRVGFDFLDSLETLP